MCGIAGIVAYRDGAPVAKADIESLRDEQRHRGPDDAGLWTSPDGRVAFGHRRLAIVDLSPLGHQPMLTPDGRYVITFNGEIYNFRALRNELETAGHRFRSQSDTEVLLEGYREWGLALFDRLRGMYAFALHDVERRETLLARDPLGIKPLYVADDGRRLAFASEIQPLRRVVGDGGLDPEGLVSFLSWGSIAAPRTLYRGIRALPPAAWLRIRPDGVEGPVAYWRLEDELGHAAPASAADAAEALRAALLDSVRHHMVADVPVGAFLSGGVDSSALVGLMSEVLTSAVRSVTLSLDVAELDESRLAREASELYRTDHHDVPIRIEAVRERIADAVRGLDQPSIDGINTFFVSEAAVKAGLKVAVSGVGGDELFGGYLSFSRIPRIRRFHDRLARWPGGAALASVGGSALAQLPLGRAAAKLSRTLACGGDDAGAYFAERGLFAPHEVRALLAPELGEAIDACDPLAELRARVRPDLLPEDERVCALEFRQYLQFQLLRDTDAMAMRHSLEVRTPLVDRDLLRAAARIPASLRRAGPAKRALREAPRPAVPPALWQRRKQGFTLPFERWLRSGGIALTLPEHPWLRGAAVSRLVDDFRRGRVHWSRVWALIVLREFLA
jgi:asparagine synthase (glutamine-hydrolysing)